MTPLTPAQLSALADAAAGLTAPQAAALRGVSRKTVETHRYDAIRRLKARNMMHAVHIATATGLVAYDAPMTYNRKPAPPPEQLDLSEPDAPEPMTRVSRELAARDRAQMERRR